MILTANAKLVDDKMKFDCTAGDGHQIISDYTPPYGRGEGPTSLEIFLASLCSCLGGTLAVILRQSGKSFSGIQVAAEGNRKQTHPTCFDFIEIIAKVASNEATQEDLDRAMKVAEERMCPVAAMIRGNVEVSWKAELV